MQGIVNKTTVADAATLVVIGNDIVCIAGETHILVITIQILPTIQTI